MRISIRLLLMALSCSSITATAAETPEPNLQHPGNTALAKQGNGKWSFTSFPGMARLYLYDKDGPDKANCNAGCASAWPPLLVPAEDTSTRLGDWKVVVRTDGTRQWSYKGHPVYIRFHDIAPDADTETEGFHLLEP